MNNTLKQHAQTLHLSGLLESLPLRLQEAEANRLPHEQFLELLFQDEINVRQQRQMDRRTKVADFHAHYALMGDATRWSEAAHDSTLFPAFTAAMVPELSDEAARFFDYVTFDLGGSFQDLITKPVAFVNKDLAPIYGLSAASLETLVFW
jgi:hypothetical protein